MDMNNMQWHKLEPTDAWFFRDGRPSNLGEDQSDLESLFPPHASTVVGAIRAALAREQGWKEYNKSWDDSLKSVLGDGFENLGKLSFCGPFLMKENELLFPAPGHLLGKEVSDKNSRKKFQTVSVLQPSTEKICCDLGKVHLPVVTRRKRDDEDRPKSPDSFFVTSSGMNRILNGQFPDESQTHHRNGLFQLEARVGLEREVETRTAKKGALYSPQYVRLKKGVSLAMGISGLPEGWKLPAYFPLGGESRLAACELFEASSLLPRAEADNCDMLILATPARFSASPWYGANPQDDAGQLNSALSGKVKTALYDRPVKIGGWDSREGKRGPLPMQPYVPAGAVWWLEEPLKQNGPLLLGDSIRTAYGYGFAFPGKSIT